MSVKRLNMIHTNDLHSHFTQWPKTVQVIKRIKQECELKGEPHLLFDIGDHMDRSHYLTEGTLGKVNVALLNHLGYNYVTIGNNEGITFSREQLSELYTDASFKVLVNNLLEPNDDYPKWLRPQAIHQLQDWKIGIIGTTADFSLFYELLGWKMIDPTDSLEEQINALQHDVDVVVLLSHLGLFRDEQLAERITGIDIIIGAHTHHVLTQGKMVKQTFINQAGRAGQYVGQIVIEKELKDMRNRLHITSSCIPTDTEPEDQETVKLLKDWHTIAQRSLSTPIATLDHDLEIDWHAESDLGNVLVESLHRWCHADIALVNAGQILTHLKQGIITKRDILHICPHPINPCILYLTGEELWSVLQRSLDQDIQELKIKGFGFRGEIMGMMAVEGIQISCTLNEKGKKIITNVWQNGHNLHKKQTFKVATIDMFTFGRIFPELHQRNQTTYLLPEFLRDILAQRLHEGNFESAKKKRWLYESDSGGA